MTWASQVALVVKNPPTSTGDTRYTDSISGSERSLEVGNGNLLQYSCLENSIGRGTWHIIVHVAAELDSTEQLSMRVTCIFILSYFGQNRNWGSKTLSHGGKWQVQDSVIGSLTLVSGSRPLHWSLSGSYCVLKTSKVDPTQCSVCHRQIFCKYLLIMVIGTSIIRTQVTLPTKGSVYSKMDFNQGTSNNDSINNMHLLMFLGWGIFMFVLTFWNEENKDELGRVKTLSYSVPWVVASLLFLTVESKISPPPHPKPFQIHSIVIVISFDSIVERDTILSVHIYHIVYQQLCYQLIIYSEIIRFFPLIFLLEYNCFTMLC